MFSIKNNQSEVAFLFSEELKNTKGIELATKTMSKRDSSCYENIEIDIRRSVFTELPRGNIERFSLKLYRKLYKLTKKQMRNYKTEISENWQFLGSEYDLIRIYVRKFESCVEKVNKDEYLSHPTYFPCFKRSMV